MSNDSGNMRERSSHALYLGAGVYLLYLVYGMVGDIMRGTEHQLMLAVASAVFGAVGAFLVYRSVKFFMTNRYREPDDETDETQEDSAVETLEESDHKE